MIAEKSIDLLSETLTWLGGWSRDGRSSRNWGNVRVRVRDWGCMDYGTWSGSDGVSRYLRGSEKVARLLFSEIGIQVGRI